MKIEFVALIDGKIELLDSSDDEAMSKARWIQCIIHDGVRVHHADCAKSSSPREWQRDKVKIRVLKDDVWGGYRDGDVFSFRSGSFIDKNGDVRFLMSTPHELITENKQATQEAYNVTPDTKYLLFAFERSWPHACLADAERQAKTLVGSGVPVSAIKVKPVGDAVDLKLTFGMEE